MKKPTGKKNNIPARSKLWVLIDEAHSRSYSAVEKQEANISSAIDEREKLENRAFAQDIILKRNTLIVLFIFLALETITIFSFSYFQAVRLQKFQLDEWSFRLLIAATISQITLMVQLAVKHLFPEKK